jgi:hypothetical protein
MPIDPNIAMGVRPMEQPNVLGQMAQVMAMRQAQQEYEGSAGVNKLARQGVQDPYAYMQYGKPGRDTAASITKIQEEKLKSDEKRNVMLGGLAGPVLENPTPTTFNFALDRAVNYGLMTPKQKQEVMAQYGGNPESIKGYAAQIFKGSINAQAQQANATQIRGQDLTHGAAMANVGVSRDRFNLEREKYTDQLNYGGDIVTTTMPNPETGEPMEVQTRRNIRGGGLIPLEVQAPPMRVDISPSSASASYQAGNGSRNDLATQVAPQGGAAPAANVNALNPNAPIFAKPKQVVRQPVAVIKDGVVTLVPPEQAVGMTPATPGAEKALEKTVVAKEGKQAVNGVLNTLYSEYNNLVKSGGITDTRKSAEDNIAARTGASGLGQLTGSYTGSESQSFRDTIEQTRPLLLTAIMKATGLSATQLNSNVELQTYLKTATDPKVSIQSNVKALNNISSMFGIGEKFEVPEVGGAKPKETKPTDAPPAGLAPDIAKLWQYMTPEDRKLWQK